MATSGITAAKKKPKSPRAASKLSRLHKPEGLSLEAWQIELRRQFGREQKFKLDNVGREPIFSEFQVSNPTTKNTYRVVIRGNGLGDNFCACPDFATNTLGTCKHIEFTLAKLGGRRGAKVILKMGFQPPYSEVYLSYGTKREVRFRKGTDCPAGFADLASKYFDAQGMLKSNSFSRFEEFLSESARFDHELRCFEEVLGFIAEVRDRARREELLRKAFPRGIQSRHLRSCCARLCTIINGRALCLPHAPAGASSVMKWDWGKRFRRLRQWRSWLSSLGSSAS
jgi:hypothetical protein